MNNKSLIVFDLDGTLNKTELHSVPAQTRVLREFGAPEPTPEKIKGTFGATYEEYTETLMPGFSEERKQAYLRRVVDVEEEFLKKFGKPYSGVVEMLNGLHEMGFETAVCSNASIKYITVVLNSLGLFDLIDYIQPLIKGHSKNDSLRLLLQKTEPRAAVMVGDTVFDQAAAQANKIPFVGCLYGYRPHEMEKAEFKISEPTELLKLIGKILK